MAKGVQERTATVRTRRQSLQADRCLQWHELLDRSVVVEARQQWMVDGGSKRPERCVRRCTVPSSRVSGGPCARLVDCVTTYLMTTKICDNSTATRIRKEKLTTVKFNRRRWHRSGLDARGNESCSNDSKSRLPDHSRPPGADRARVASSRTSLLQSDSSRSLPPFPLPESTSRSDFSSIPRLPLPAALSVPI